eukprot:scaffold51320_cov20-Tisochrysis_lutea.AAC.1
MQKQGAPTVCLPDENALFSLVKSCPEVNGMHHAQTKGKGIELQPMSAYLLVGYSEKALFESVVGAVKALQPYFIAAEKRCNGK